MRRIPTLDGWRAIAILSVVMHHAATGFYARESDYWANSLTIYGGFGVDVFFALSGLLITKLLLEEWRATETVSLRGFYIRRAFRILPPYLAMLAALTAAGLWNSGREAAGCLLFFRNYVPDAMVGRWSQHLWSLAVEEHFYFLWPGLLALCGRRRGKMAAAGVALAIGIWRMVDAQFNIGLALDVQPHFRSDLRLDALLWGAVVAFILDEARDRERFAKQMRFGLWTAAVVVALVCVIAYSLLTAIWLAALMPMVLAGTVTHPQWRVSRALEWMPLAWIGRISYSLYLWQQLFLWPGWEHPSHWWLLWPWNLIAVFAVAAASYYVLERPMLRIGRRLAAASTHRSDVGGLVAQVPARLLE